MDSSVASNFQLLGVFTVCVSLTLGVVYVCMKKCRNYTEDTEVLVNGNNDRIPEV